LHERTRSLSARADEPRRYVGALEELIDAALGSGDGKLGCELLLRLGSVYEHELGLPDEAAATYARAEDTSENLVEVWRAMASLAVDRQPRLAALRKLADSPEVIGEERADVLYAVANLELRTSDTTEAGLVTLELALDTAGCTPRWARAAASLHKALQVSSDREPIVRLYETVARASGDEGLLLDALWAASTLPRPDQETVREAFVLADRLGATDRATRLLERAVEAAQQYASDPAEALWAMLQLAERSEGADDPGASLLWMTRAADMADPEESSRLLMRMAELARVAGDTQVLEMTLARASNELVDSGDRNSARMELCALLLEQSERSAEAGEVLRAVLDEDPDHREAAQRLADLLDRAGDHGALATLLTRQLDGARDDNDASCGIALALRLGDLLTAGAPREAAEVYRATLEWIPDAPQLLQRLVARLDPREDAAERASLVEQLLAHESGARRFDLALELCGARCALGDHAGLERAVEIARDVDPCHWPADASAVRPVLEEALDAIPDSLSALDLFARCLLGAGDTDAANAAVTAAIERSDAGDATLAERLAIRASVRSANGEHEAAVADLEHALAIDGRWLSDLQTALEKARGAAADDGDLEAERHYVLRQSELLRRSGQSSAARAVLTDLVEGSFYDREVTEQVLELDVTAGRWADVVKGCNKLLAFECGPELASVALLLADACDRLGRPEEARRGLERAQDQDPANPALRERLRALYERMSAHGPLADLLVLEAGEAPDDDRRFGLLREAGRLRLRRTDAPASAVGPLSEAASLCPTDHEVNLLLADALLATGLVDEAAQLLEDAIARHSGKRSHDLAALQHRMARAVAARAPGKQLPWLVAAFGGHPKDVDIASDLAEVATAQQQYDIAMQAWRAVISASEGSPVVRATAYARQARIAQMQGDVPRALVLAKRAKSEHPELAEAASLLRDLGARS
jgi:tetratricopeptide (TPR) repeat protein